MHYITILNIKNLKDNNGWIDLVYNNVDLFASFRYKIFTHNGIARITVSRQSSTINISLLIIKLHVIRYN